MKPPLHEDQIHAPAFQKLCDFIWSPQLHCPYVASVISEHNKNLKTFNKDKPLTSDHGIIYIGLCQLIEDCFDAMPTDGSYIIIHRTNDRSFTEAMYAKKPSSVKYIYTVDCEVNHPDVFAIPIGFNTIDGESQGLKDAAIAPAPTRLDKIFVRYNVNSQTIERNASIPVLKSMPYATVIEEQISSEEFFEQLKSHKYTMSLQGCGKDACRTWSAIALGSIPVITDCVEMRHFEDLPVIFVPNDLTTMTIGWLDSQDLSGKSTDRMRMSYWIDHINKHKNKLQW